MLAHIELRNQLIRFLSNELPFDNFEDWFVQNSWNIHRNPDLVAQRLAYAVELRLAEYDSDHLLEPELRRELSELVSAYSIRLSQEPSNISNGASLNLSLHQPWAVPSAGMSLVMASE
jgi:hypothetical protein